MTQQRWLRIIPVAFVMYTIAFVDRTNISLALGSMSHDLHMDPAQAGAAAGIFFWGYSLLQIPGGYLASRWSAKRFIAILLVAWGLCSMATGLVHTWRELWALRLLLGVAEGGVWPATLVLLTHWFPRQERARANALWMMCLPLAVVVSSPLSGWILGLWGWRALLVSEGALPFLWLAIWLRFADDRPREAKWISSGERKYLEATLRREAAQLKALPSEPFWRPLLRPEVLMLVGVAFLLYAGNYGYLFWLPSALASPAGRVSEPLSSFQIGVLNGIPFLIASVAMVLISRDSDRRLERRGHMGAALAASGLCLVAMAAVGTAWPALRLTLLMLAAAGPLAALAPLYAIPAEMLPAEFAGPAMGLVCALGNLGGYYGPLLVGHLARSRGSLAPGFGLLGIGLLAASSLAFLLPAKAPSMDVAQRLFVFVCSGNTSRSPIAQAICNAEIARRLKVRLEMLGEMGVEAVSAGLSARPGEPITADAARALAELGVPVTAHASRNLTASLVEKAEAIFCMTEKQRRVAIERFPQAAAKTHCLCTKGDLDDPTGGSPEVFLELARRIQSLVSRRLDEFDMVEA